MFKDTESAEVFARIHAHDQLIEQARHIGDPVEDTSLFGSHARGERDASALVALIGVAAIVLLAILLLKAL